MTTGAMVLAGVTFVVIMDMMIAIYFRELADRVESGESTNRSIDPPGARRMAKLLLINAPIIWIVTALICFGVIPAGIDPIKF